MSDYMDCPECGQPRLKWDAFSGHWDCLACKWSTEGPAPKPDEDGDEHHAG